MTADPWFQMVRVTRNNILFRCIKGILKPGISEPEFASVYSGLIPGPISVDVSGRNDRCEEDLGSGVVWPRRLEHPQLVKSSICEGVRLYKE